MVRRRVKIVHLRNLTNDGDRSLFGTQALQDKFKDEAPFFASGVCQVSASSQSIEDLRIPRARLRRVTQSPSAYPAKMRLVSEAHLHMPSQMVSLSNCHVVPYSTEFHRSTVRFQLNAHCV